MIHRARLTVTAALLAAFAHSQPLSGQSLTAGALRGSVRAADGSPLGGAAVTIETAGGGAFKNLETREDGSFVLRMVLPATYSVLVEYVGYQPVRYRGVVVAAGGTTVLSVVLQLRPPPITSVTELDQPGSLTGSVGRIISGREISALADRRDATGLLREHSEIVASLDGRRGLGLAAGGLVPGWSRLLVDGIPELLLRHPGVASEPAEAPLFLRETVDQAQVISRPLDTEYRGVPGAILGLQTKPGGNRVRFSPYASFSQASLGGRSIDNPADSSATSIQAGVSITGPLKPDTAYFALSGHYRSIETPTAYPWESNTSQYLGQPASLREVIPQIGTGTYGTALQSAVAPAVRSWKGGNASARVDWRLSPSSAFMLRGGFASWKETNPILGTVSGNDAGGALKARDLSIAASIVTASGLYSNEARIGINASRREWTRTGPPPTWLTAEGIRFGADGTVPALFDVKTLSFSDAIQYAVSRHTLKGGITVDRVNYLQRYLYGDAGIYRFGDLDSFGSAVGTYFESTSATPEASFGFWAPGVFLQDTYEVSTGLQLLLGVRWETQILPVDLITPNQDWANLTGLKTDSAFKDRRGIQPRFGFVLNPGNRGTWIVQGDLGLYAGGLDPAIFAEAISHDGSVLASRVSGSLSAWPAAPAAASILPRLTLLKGGEGYHAPRTLKSQMGVVGALGGGMTLRFSGAYHHTDYLQRRSDLNRASGATATTQEGRPVYGALKKQGGLVTSEVRSSRRFQSYDLVSALSPTGFSDLYEVTGSLDRSSSGPFSIGLSYTYSRLRDNLVGLLNADPADQLSPFPEGVDGADWDIGRSDLDVPHRVGATAEYRAGGRMQFTLAARARWRSGLPFTPGFRHGVDINGDLGGNNDPAPADAAATPTGTGVMVSCDGSAVGAFAARNSCRDTGAGSVDLRAAFSLPFGSGTRLAVTIDAFNVVASATGVVDHAAVLVDPAQSLTTANNVVTVPFLANPRFGTLLSRRTEPRLVRLGLRVEY